LCVGPIVADRLTAIASGARWIFPGGNGTIFAAVAAARGAKVTIAGRVGNDLNGARIRQLLTETGVQTSHLLSVTTQTKVCEIEIDPDGEWRRIGSTADFAYLEVSDVDMLQSAHPQWIHIAGLSSMLRTCEKATIRLIHLFRERGVTLSFGLNPLSKQQRAAVIECVQFGDFVFCNREEFSVLIDRSVKSPQECLPALRGSPFRRCAVTLGAGGAILRVDDDVLLWERSPRLPAVSTLGAGDTFAAAFVVAMARGDRFEVALREAVYAATQSVLYRNWDGGDLADVLPDHSPHARGARTRA
jgi:sugar/nucleoside kinase (ribokinase family)